MLSNWKAQQDACITGESVAKEWLVEDDEYLELTYPGAIKFLEMNKFLSLTEFRRQQIHALSRLADKDNSC